MKHQPKKTYTVTNWKQYNQALVDRGNLTVWVDQAILEEWLNTTKTGKQGASPKYTDTAIQTGLSLMAIYGLRLRSAEGMLRSLLTLLGSDLPVPDYSTLCRRRADLQIVLPRRPRDGRLHLVVDSSGVKIYGEGEWKVRLYGWSKRRSWRKVHLGVNEANGDILSVVTTTHKQGDGRVLPELLDQLQQPLTQVSADGAYDHHACYQAVSSRGATATIALRRVAKIRQHGNSKAPPLDRDQHLRFIRQHGRAAWRQASGYSRRSLAETAISRFKRIFGHLIWSRTLPAQASEIRLKCALLNRMAALGMPRTVAR